MKISKARIKEIIREELNEDQSGWMRRTLKRQQKREREEESWSGKALRLLSQIYSNTIEEWSQEARDSFSELQEMLRDMEDEELNK